VTGIVLVLLIGFTLQTNKNSIQKETLLAEQKLDYYPVNIALVKEDSLLTIWEAVGTFAPIRELIVMSQTQGQVVVLYKTQGQKVDPGSPIAKVDDKLLRAELLVAQANFEKAQRDLNRFENLADGDAATAQQLEQIKVNAKNAEAKLITIRKKLEDTSIKAPISGRLNQVYIEKGAVLGPGVRVCEIVDIGRLKLLVRVAENEVLHIREGQQLTVSADVYPGLRIQGLVANVSLKADRSLQYTVKIELENNPEYVIRPGMFGTAYFSNPNQKSSLAIDRKALIGTLDNPHVFVVMEGRAQFRQISIGRITTDLVEVLEGLNNGDQVVIAGQNNLQQDSKVKIIDSVQ